MGRKPHDPAAVDAYLAALPAGQRTALERVRAIVHDMVPGVRERIAYAIPVFADETGDLCGMSAHTNHLSIQIMSRQVAADLRDRLLPFPIHGAQALHFTPEAPIPEASIALILDAKRTANQARGRRS